MLKTFQVTALAGLTTLGLLACNSDGYSVSESSVKSHYVETAYAAYSDSLTTAQALQSAVQTLLANPTEENLALARGAYKAARVPYQQSEIMRWDTVITLGQELDADGGPVSVDEWEGQVNAWPLDENHIVAIIQGDEVISKQLLMDQNGADDNEANVTTGVHAVEFMLWGEDENGTGPGAGERPATDFATDGSCADAYCERRGQYLSAAVDLLVEDLTAMEAEWSPEAATTEGTLAYNFLHSEQALDYILGAIRSMAADELAGARMSSGLELFDPEESHDCFSDLSHVAIYNNFIGVRNAFYGEYGNLRGPGLADLIKEKDTATFLDIHFALQSIEGLMTQLYQAGERETNTVRFDQIIGQGSDGVERQIAEQAVTELIAIDQLFQQAQELLSLEEVTVGGSGD